MKTNDIIYIDGSYEYLEFCVNKYVKLVSSEEKISENVMSEIKKDLNFIKENKIATAFVVFQKVIEYCELKGYPIKYSKINIKLPFISCLYWCNTYSKSCIRYMPEDQKIIEITFSKENKEDILSFVAVIIDGEDYKNTGIKFTFE